MIINGEHWQTFGSVDEALDSSINADGHKDILQLVTETLSETEALLLLAQKAENYEQQNHACMALASKLSATLGYDESLLFDVVRELSALSLRHRYAQHQKRLSVSRKQISLWRKTTQAWAAAAEQHAADQLEVALTDAGFI